MPYEAARGGNWDVILTPNKAVPKDWFGDIRGKPLLCLASGGGQQSPILAAAGADVTSFDNSEEQLSKDRQVADQHGLKLNLVRGDMADLSVFSDHSFEIIFHPVANVFAEDIRPVWRECHRVLKPGGRLLAGFMNPMFFLFDHEEIESTDQFVARFRVPYSDVKSFPKERLDRLVKEGTSLEFGHSLEDQIGGQIMAGFVITGFYEDDWDEDSTPLNRFGPLYISTCARKLPLV